MTPYGAPARRARRWPIVLLTLGVLGLAASWTVFCNYAPGQAEPTIAGWRDREANLGRVYLCGRQAIGGFPFRIEVRCDDAAADLRNVQPPLSLKLKNVVVVAQVYQPTLLISEFSAPLAVTAAAGTPSLAAGWTLAQRSEERRVGKEGR